MFAKLSIPPGRSHLLHLQTGMPGKQSDKAITT